MKNKNIYGNLGMFLDEIQELVEPEIKKVLDVIFWGSEILNAAEITEKARQLYHFVDVDFGSE